MATMFVRGQNATDTTLAPLNGDAGPADQTYLKFDNVLRTRTRLGEQPAQRIAVAAQYEGAGSPSAFVVSFYLWEERLKTWFPLPASSVAVPAGELVFVPCPVLIDAASTGASLEVAVVLTVNSPPDGVYRVAIGMDYGAGEAGANQPVNRQGATAIAVDEGAWWVRLADVDGNPISGSTPLRTAFAPGVTVSSVGFMSSFQADPGVRPASVSVYNKAASPLYLVLFNRAVVPNNGDANFVDIVQVGSKSRQTIRYEVPNGVLFDLGFVAALSTTDTQLTLAPAEGLFTATFYP